MSHFFFVCRKDFVDRHSGVIDRAEIVVADGNLPPDGFARVARLCVQKRVPLVFEPTSVAKCSVPFRAEVGEGIRPDDMRSLLPKTRVVRFLFCYLLPRVKRSECDASLFPSPRHPLLKISFLGAQQCSV